MPDKARRRTVDFVSDFRDHTAPRTTGATKCVGLEPGICVAGIADTEIAVLAGAYPAEVGDATVSH